MRNVQQTAEAYLPQITFKPLDEVRPYANNPRKNDDAVEYVANSIKEFGFKVPIRMLSEILQDFTDEGDIILDVFGGSGSTLIACEQTGRTCYMAELSPEYVDVIIARYEKLTGNKAVLLNEKTTMSREFVQMLP